MRRSRASSTETEGAGSVGNRQARWIAALLVCVLAWFGWLTLGGQVIAAHDNSLQLGAPASQSAKRSNLRYSDHATAYIPELHALHHAPRAGWIATWTDSVEMGRPLAHVSGFSPAYPPAYALGLLFDDAYVLYTALVVLHAIVAALGAFLFFNALGLYPVACFSGALMLALGPTPAHWATFAMYPAGFAWTLVALWLVTRFARDGGFSRLIGVAFTVYAILLSGYPQHLVWHGFAVAGWSVLELLRLPRRTRVHRTLALSASVLVGIIAALPVYADLALAASHSARLDVESGFFFAKMPRFETLKDVARYVAMVFDPTLFGNPVDPSYPLFFGGVAWGPLVSCLALISFTCCVARAWWWQALFLIASAMTLFPAFYTFGIEHLGLGLSRALPLFGAWIPGCVCAAIALDQLLRSAVDPMPSNRRRVRTRVIGTSAVACLALFVCVGVSSLAASVSMSSMLVSVAITIAAVGMVWHPLPALAVTLALVSACADGLPLVLTQRLTDIRRTSPLVEHLRELGSRYAFVGDELPRLLPPNEELFLGLASVHSYDSLSPTAYQDWTTRISRRGAETRGRKFTRISDDHLLASDRISFANIGLIIATHPLAVAGFELARRLPPLYLYRAQEPPHRFARIASWTQEAGGVHVSGTLSAHLLSVPHLDEDQGDRQRFTLEPSEEPSLFFASRHAHSQWRARVDGVDTPTVCINGFYQGVLLPKGAHTLELEFRPWVRWAWVSELGFAVAALVALGRISKRAIESFRLGVRGRMIPRVARWVVAALPGEVRHRPLLALRPNLAVVANLLLGRLPCIRLTDGIECRLSRSGVHCSTPRFTPASTTSSPRSPGSAARITG